MRVLRRMWAAVRNAWIVASWMFWDRELTVLVLYGVVGFFVGVFDRVFKKRGERW